MRSVNENKKISFFFINIFGARKAANVRYIYMGIYIAIKYMINFLRQTTIRKEFCNVVL